MEKFTPKQLQRIAEILSREPEEPTAELVKLLNSCDWCGKEKDNPHGLCPHCLRFPKYR